jgi:hypothetical protein
MISLIEARRSQQDAEGFEEFADDRVVPAWRCTLRGIAQDAASDFVSRHYGRGRDVRCGKRQSVRSAGRRVRIRRGIPVGRVWIHAFKMHCSLSDSDRARTCAGPL